MTTPNQPEDKPEFINCELAFKCPKDWFDLELTNKAGIKHCNQCNKNVHLCTTQEELSLAVEENLCIAFFEDPSLQTRFKLSREKCEANGRDPDFKPLVILGLPRSQYIKRLDLGDFRAPSRRMKLKTF
jgi:hypothetical protein